MDKLKLIEAILGTNCYQAPSEDDCAFTVGEKIFVRTVTHYLTGQIKAIKGKFLVLSDAAWIADTGRYHDALVNGEFSEIEPYPCDVRLNTETIIDCCEWKHPLPKGQK